VTLTACSRTAIAACNAPSVDKTSYVAKNEALLRSTPVYPGSTLIRDESAGQPTGSCPIENGPPYESYVTTRVYSTTVIIPKGKVVRYYRKILAGKWHLQGASGTVPGEPPRDSTFRRGNAMLAITQFDTGWQIDVDYKIYGIWRR
jgi:hypothetical protein